VEKKKMLEHITRGLYYFEVHLLFASIVGLVAWVLTSMPGGSATTKYWISVVTMLNFFSPLGAVLDKSFASRLSWATPLGLIGDAANSISHSSAASVLLMVWLFGTLVLFTRLCFRIRAGHRDDQVAAGQGALDSGRNFTAEGVPVRFGESRHAPAVHGFLRPHISLPQGIDRLLSKQELHAVLIHELTHARRRDNLIRLIHEVGLCALWFHPLVWITGSRLALYQELSCDEAVIQSARGGDLVSALAKLAEPEEAFLLQASASSFLMSRLPRLTAVQPQPTSRTASRLLVLLFGAALLGGVLGTVAHTACCWVVRT
jgi:beta-lactamase regulating signal transducer with metallopeptidase domain